MPAQKEIWDKIAQEWHKYKTIPAKHTIEFLKKTSGKVLDLGSGSGRHLMKIKKEKINAEFKQANIWKIPYENKFFDYAICISALHCINGPKNREKAIKELYRVLKKGGKAEIGVWNINSKRFKNSQKEKYIGWTDKGKRYYYLYDEKEIHELFKKIGFKIISTHNSEMMINFIVGK